MHKTLPRIKDTSKVNYNLSDIDIYSLAHCVSQGLKATVVGTNPSAVLSLGTTHCDTLRVLIYVATQLNI